MLTFNVIHIKSRNVKAASEWYQKFLGAHVIEWLDADDGDCTVRLLLKGLAINITQHPNAESLPGVPLDRFIGMEHIAFTVDNLDRTFKELKENNVEIISPININRYGTARIIFVRAPDGIRIELTEYL